MPERSRAAATVGAAPAAYAGGLVQIVSPALLGAEGDVARARERHRQRRLRRLFLLLLVPMTWILWRDFAGKSLFPHLHLHIPTQYVVAMVLIVVLLTVMLGPMLGAGASPHVLYRADDIDVGLDQVVGIDNLKSEIIRTLNLFLGHKRFRDSLGGTPRRGVLFEGPPGTGKTYVAQAMAKEADVPFLFVSASAFQSMFYGQTNRKIRSYFRALRRYAVAEGGAIGFIEEIDAIGGARAGMGSLRGEGVSGVVNELLVQLQSFDEPTRRRRLMNALFIESLNRLLPPQHRIPKPAHVRPNVLVIAATNRAADLDPALVRPGRFDRSLHFSLPGREGRRAIVAHYLATKAHDPALDLEQAAEEIAGMTPGYSPAALRALLDEALIVALTHGREALTLTDVTEAKLAIETGIKDPTEYTPEERRRIALHEAGHATVAYYLGESRRLDVLSIVKRSESLGLLQHSDTEERFTRKKSEAETLLKIAMGGRAAEELWFDGEISSGPAGDLAAATQLAAQMVGAFGMGDSLVSVAGDPGAFGQGLVGKVLGDSDLREEVDRLLHRSYDAARDTLLANRDVVEALAGALVERHELLGAEILAVIEQVPGARKGKAVANRSYDALVAAARN